jgi:hypothetical protein
MEDPVDIAAGSLMDSFPPGMFGGEESPGTRNAYRMLAIVEQLIRESSASNALLARYSLLQTFPRVEVLPPEEGKESDFVPEPMPGILQQFCTALFPESLSGLLPLLNENEIELLLKHVVAGHELWGHAEGVASLVRTFLEGSLHDGVPVRVHALADDDRGIPVELWSHLGAKSEYSALGKNFVLGKRVAVRPKEYTVDVGPISRIQLERLQEDGWAEDTRPSQKLYQLVGVAEPFYLRADIRYLFEKSGFRLYSAMLGKSRLGATAAAEIV